jgi:hypothetical protein
MAECLQNQRSTSRQNVTEIMSCIYRNHQFSIKTAFTRISGENAHRNRKLLETVFNLVRVGTGHGVGPICKR